ncbi:hypothetical protein KAK05_02135 [Candidatus Parcubacteria bacterium]|nr:hypothetical protein [Candidatus Parcubacteria bacterium]
MSNKQKTIKPFIFLIIIFSLLVNLIYLSYEKIYENGNYATHNNEIINYYENDYFNVPVKIKQQAICSNLESPFGNMAIYYKLVFLAVLLTIISIMSVFLILIFKRHKKITLYRKDAFIIIGAEIISIFIFIWAFMLESDYYFTYCVKFL